MLEGGLVMLGHIPYSCKLKSSHVGTYSFKVVSDESVASLQERVLFLCGELASFQGMQIWQHGDQLLQGPGEAGSGQFGSSSEQSRVSVCKGSFLSFDCSSRKVQFLPPYRSGLQNLYLDLNGSCFPSSTQFELHSLQGPQGLHSASIGHCLVDLGIKYPTQEKMRL